MKKSLLFIVSVLTLLVISAAPVSSASGKLSVKSSKAENNNITLNLYAEHPSAMIAASAIVEYDSNVLKLVRTQNGTVFKSIYVKSKTIDTNPYMLLYVDIEKEQAPTNGILASYTFEVLDSAKSGETEIKFYLDQALDTNSKDLTFDDCTIKLLLKSAADSSQSSDYTSSTITDGDTITIPQLGLDDEDQTEEKPDNHETISSQIDNNESDNKADVYENTFTRPSNNESDNKDSNDDKDSGKNKTVILLIAIGGVLVAGTAITLALIFFKKNSQKVK